MPTAQHDVWLCRCGHGHHLHERLKTAGLYGGCLACACTRFEQADRQHLQEGEQRRRITED